MANFFFYLYKKLIDQNANDHAIELLMSEMMSAGLIKEAEHSMPGIGMVVIDYKGARINESGGWLKKKLDAIGDDEKMHLLLDYMIRTNPKKYGWNSQELSAAFDGALDQYEVEYIGGKLLEDGVVDDCRTKDGFAVGLTDKSRQAHAGKKYLTQGRTSARRSKEPENYLPPDKFTESEITQIFSRLDELSKKLERIETGQQIFYTTTWMLKSKNLRILQRCWVKRIGAKFFAENS